jgi:hypothetical protein
LEQGRLDFVLGPVYPGRRSPVERARLYDDPLVYLRAGEGGSSGVAKPNGVDGRSPVTLPEIADDVFLLVHDACGLTRVTRQLFASRRLPLKEYEGQGVSYQVLEEWTRVGVGSAILPESKLSAPGLGHPIVLGNGHRATIRFEAVWLPSAAPAPHLHALTQHLKSAGAALAQKEQT